MWVLCPFSYYKCNITLSFLQIFLLNYFHKKWYYRRRDCYSEYWYESYESDRGDEFICYFHKDEGYHEWERSKCDESQGECDDPKYSTKHEIRDSEYHSKDKCTYIPICEYDTIDDMIIG